MKIGDQQMQKVITVLAVAVMSFALCATSYGQDAGPAGGRLQRRGRLARNNRTPMRPMERIQQDVLNTLDLAPDQKKQISDLNNDVAQKIAGIAQSNKGTQGNTNVGAQRRNIMRDYDNKLERILTADQWRRYREGMLVKLKELREKRADRLGTNSKPPQ